MKILLTTLEALNEPRAGDFLNAVNTLNEAAEAKLIFNVVLNDVKDTIVGRGSRFEVFAEKVGYGDNRPAAIDDKHYYDFTTCYPHEAAGRHKRIVQYYGKVNEAVDTFIDAVDELAAIGAVIKACKPYIVKGRVPSENPVQRDLSNTGTCGICGKNVKLSADGKLVHHGFQRPGTGEIVGDCFGVYFAPIEVSTEANVEFGKTLATTLASQNVALGRLKSGLVNSFAKSVQKRVTINNRTHYEVRDVLVTRGEAGFENLEKAAIANKENQIRWTQSDIATNTAKINNWAARPLPGTV